MKEQKIKKLIFIALMSFLSFSQTLYAFSKDSFIDLSKTKWDYRWGDSLPTAKEENDWQRIDFPSNPPLREGRENVWYRVVLPLDLPSDPALYIFSIDLIAEVYYNNEKIYSFGSFDAKGQGKFEGWPWHMIELPQDSAGKYLYFRVYSNYPDIGLWGEISIASKAEHLKRMLDSDLLRLSASAIALFMGFLFITGFLASSSKIELFLIGSLFFTQGLDLLLSTKIIQLYFNFPLLKQYILAFCYFFLPVGIAAFLEQFIKSRYISIIRRIWQMHLGYIFVAFSLAILGYVSVASLYVYYDYIHYFITFPILSLFMLYVLFKGTKDERLVASGLLILSLSWLYSSLIAWGFVDWQEHPNYIHVFLCLLLFTYALSRRMSYASELEVANQKLCQTNETLQEVQKELTMLATFDSLTGLYNRNKINEHLQNEITLAQRYQESFGIMLLDIDDFKMVNDTYGHLVGDEVLKEFAKLLKQHIRQTDILGRWGGEEFIILVRKVDLEDTRELAEKLREIIERYNFPTLKHLTSSFGISIYQEEDTIKTLFEKVDKALYLAKNADKNRVEAII